MVRPPSDLVWMRQWLYLLSRLQQEEERERGRREEGGERGRRGQRGERGKKADEMEIEREREGEEESEGEGEKGDRAGGERKSREKRMNCRERWQKTLPIFMHKLSTQSSREGEGVISSECGALSHEKGAILSLEVLQETLRIEPTVAQLPMKPPVIQHK